LPSDGGKRVDIVALITLTKESGRSCHENSKQDEATDLIYHKIRREERREVVERPEGRKKEREKGKREGATTDRNQERARERAKPEATE
jgi:hypothetical protein